MLKCGSRLNGSAVSSVLLECQWNILNSTAYGSSGLIQWHVWRSMRAVELILLRHLNVDSNYLAIIWWYLDVGLVIFVPPWEVPRSFPALFIWLFLILLFLRFHFFLEHYVFISILWLLRVRRPSNIISRHTWIVQKSICIYSLIYKFTKTRYINNSTNTVSYGR